MISSDYGRLPDMTAARVGSDICFTWNGTTSGVRVPDAKWLSNCKGLVLCDATSAVFGQKVAWEKLDAITFSWQKAMGGEAAHGMLVLSPKAIDRLESYIPDRPIPKVFRLVKNGKLIEELNYLYGYENGSQKVWYLNGKIKSNYVIKNSRRFGLLGTKNCVNTSEEVF